MIILATKTTFNYLCSVYDGYSVIQGHPNIFISYLHDQPEFMQKLRNGFDKNEIFFYWAKDLEFNEPFVRCTLPCSSGAPIFNHVWQLIGMHIKGSYTDRTTVDFFSIGVPIKQILKDCQEISKYSIF